MPQIITYWNHRHTEGLRAAFFSWQEIETIEFISPMFHGTSYLNYLEIPENCPESLKKTAIENWPIYLIHQCFINTNIVFEERVNINHPKVFWPLEKIVQEAQKRTKNPIEICRNLDIYGFLEEYDQTLTKFTLDFERIEENISSKPIREQRF